MLEKEIDNEIKINEKKITTIGCLSNLQLINDEYNKIITYNDKSQKTINKYEKNDKIDLSFNSINEDNRNINEILFYKENKDKPIEKHIGIFDKNNKLICGNKYIYNDNFIVTKILHYQNGKCIESYQPCIIKEQEKEKDSYFNNDYNYFAFQKDFYSNKKYVKTVYDENEEPILSYTSYFQTIDNYSNVNIKYNNGKIEVSTPELELSFEDVYEEEYNPLQPYKLYPKTTDEIIIIEKILKIFQKFQKEQQEKDVLKKQEQNNKSEFFNFINNKCGFNEDEEKKPVFSLNKDNKGKTSINVNINIKKLRKSQKSAMKNFGLNNDNNTR